MGSRMPKDFQTVFVPRSQQLQLVPIGKRTMQIDDLSVNLSADSLTSARQAVGAKVNGQVVDLHRPLADGDQLQLLTPRDEDSLEILRHSTAHILASAVKRLFPTALISIGRWRSAPWETSA